MNSTLRCPSQRDELASVLAVLEPVLDIVDEPVDSPVAPVWCSRRGWAEFLAALGDAELEESERGGFTGVLLKAPGAPAELRELAQAVQRCTHLPALDGAAWPLPPAALRGIAARKRGQLASLLGALEPLAAEAARIVDVGAGRGHFARLAAELLQRPALALDRDGALLQSGGQRRDQRARQLGELQVQFVEADIGRELLQLQGGDLAVGLHACGELGDRLVTAAAGARCDLALVSCCLQKTRAAHRSPLSRAAGGLTLRRGALGLTNLTPREQGVEASLTDNLHAREARLALRYLLRARGLPLASGEEMRGINRRRAQAGFEDLARHALALRQLPPPSSAELRAHAAQAQRDHRVMRRLTLPRSLLARLIELAIVRDRAAALEEHGMAVAVAQLFEQRLTPRNTVLFASRAAQRLPVLGAG